MWSSANSFLSVLWWRGVSICYRLTGEFWINSIDGVRFLFIVQVIDRAQKKAQSSFCGQGKFFIMKLFFEEFNLIFFTAESAWPALKCNQGSGVLENFEVLNLFTLWSRKLRF